MVFLESRRPGPLKTHCMHTWSSREAFGISSNSCWSTSCNTASCKLFIVSPYFTLSLICIDSSAHTNLQKDSNVHAHLEYDWRSHDAALLLKLSRPWSDQCLSRRPPGNLCMHLIEFCVGRKMKYKCNKVSSILAKQLRNSSSLI